MYLNDNIWWIHQSPKEQRRVDGNVEKMKEALGLNPEDFYLPIIFGWLLTALQNILVGHLYIMSSY